MNRERVLFVGSESDGFKTGARLFLFYTGGGGKWTSSARPTKPRESRLPTSLAFIPPSTTLRSIRCRPCRSRSRCCPNTVRCGRTFRRPKRPIFRPSKAHGGRARASGVVRSATGDWRIFLREGVAQTWSKHRLYRLSLVAGRKPVSLGSDTRFNLLQALAGRPKRGGETRRRISFEKTRAISQK